MGSFLAWPISFLLLLRRDMNWHDRISRRAIWNHLSINGVNCSRSIPPILSLRGRETKGSGCHKPPSPLPLGKCWMLENWKRILSLSLTGALLWRLINDALPLDANMKRKGLQMSSKCCCCINGAEETRDHLFLHSEQAYGNFLVASLAKMTNSVLFSNYSFNGCMDGVKARKLVWLLWEWWLTAYGSSGKRDVLPSMRI